MNKDQFTHDELKVEFEKLASTTQNLAEELVYQQWQTLKSNIMFMFVGALLSWVTCTAVFCK